MSNPSRKTTVKMITQNLKTFKQQAEEIENQYILAMVETIKDLASQGLTDIDTFRKNIEEAMQKVDEVAAISKLTVKVYGTTKRSFL